LHPKSACHAANEARSCIPYTKILAAFSSDCAPEDLPADAFYEWRVVQGGKQASIVRRRRPLAELPLAGRDGDRLSIAAATNPNIALDALPFMLKPPT
jgi:hypothetical protein